MGMEWGTHGNGVERMGMEWSALGWSPSPLSDLPLWRGWPRLGMPKTAGDDESPLHAPGEDGRPRR